MKNTALFTLIIIFSTSLLHAVASENDQLLIMNYAIAKDAKNAALAAFPFIPKGSIKSAKSGIKKKFNLDEEDLKELKHKSELTNEADIVEQAKIVANKHKDLLNKAGYKAS